MLHSFIAHPYQTSINCSVISTKVRALLFTRLKASALITLYLSHKSIFHIHSTKESYENYLWSKGSNHTNIVFINLTFI